MYRNFKTEESSKEMAASGKTLKTVVFLGSTREGRFGLRVAKFIKKHLEQAGHSVDLIGIYYKHKQLCCSNDAR